jgi:hypothetical protein
MLLGCALVHKIKHATLLHAPDTFVIRHRNIATDSMPECEYREFSLNLALQLSTAHEDACHRLQRLLSVRNFRS